MSLQSLNPKIERLFSLTRRARCCPPPPQVQNLTAGPGGGSGEVQVTWDALPATADVAFYRVYLRHREGYFHLAVVTEASSGGLLPGRVGLVDAFDYWPWPTTPVPAPRCYVVTAVSRQGLEGPFSGQACGSPVGS